MGTKVDFSEWEKSAVAFKTINVGRQIQRSGYKTPHGIIIWEDEQYPNRSSFSAIAGTIFGALMASEDEILIDYVVDLVFGKEHLGLLSEFNGKEWVGAYCDDQHFVGWFDNMENAFRFAEKAVELGLHR